jgi:carbon-monoxide dehydrogenase medium subunit
VTFAYHEPETWAQAQELISRDTDATVLAGGTAFTLLLRQGLIRPTTVVSLRRVQGASRILADSHGGLWIGAMATHTAVVRSSIVRGAWPELADAAAKVATLRVRNQATIGGSLAHADPASDVPVMLAALDAQVVVRSATGAPRVPVDGLLVDMFTTSLAPGAFIESIQVAGRGPNTRAVYLKFTPRSVDDYATVSVGVRADVVDGVFRELRIFLGAVGAKPMRATSVEAALRGRPADPRTFAEAAALVRGDVDPIDDLRGSASYKREMARVWTERALRALAA